MAKLAGLMSRWMKPSWCMPEMPVSMCRPMAAAVALSNLPSVRFLRASAMFMPSSCSAQVWVLMRFTT